jgi:hypothetical protein
VVADVDDMEDLSPRTSVMRTFFPVCNELYGRLTFKADAKYTLLLLKAIDDILHTPSVADHQERHMGKV